MIKLVLILFSKSIDQNFFFINFSDETKLAIQGRKLSAYLPSIATNLTIFSFSGRVDDTFLKIFCDSLKKFLNLSKFLMSLCGYINQDKIIKRRINDKSIANIIDGLSSSLNLEYISLFVRKYFSLKIYYISSGGILTEKSLQYICEAGPKYWKSLQNLNVKLTPDEYSALEFIYLRKMSGMVAIRVSDLTICEENLKQALPTAKVSFSVQ